MTILYMYPYLLEHVTKAVCGGVIIHCAKPDLPLAFSIGFCHIKGL